MKGRRIIIVTLIAVLCIGCLTAASFGATKKKKETLYNVYVKGKYAYCGAYGGVYKVNLKTGSAKKLVAITDCYNADLTYYKGYIYYIYSDNIRSICRVKTSGKNNKVLAKGFEFAISKNKIYYVTPKGGHYHGKKLNRKMNLNGKHKKSTKYKAVNKYKMSNKKGYKIISKYERTSYDPEFDEYVEYEREYLVTPKGKKVKLGLH